MSLFNIHKVKYLLFAPAFYCCHNNTNTTVGMQDSQHTYYLNNNGNDNADGSKSKPWKSIAKLNIVNLKPGDTVFFEGGQTFKGNMVIDSGNNGKNDKPIVITSAGTAKPVIDGDSGTAFTINKCRYITITNLELEGLGRKQGNIKDGLLLNHCEYITVSDLHIHGFQKSGLLINSCTNIEAKKIHASENGFAGIFVNADGDKSRSSNIHISYCATENNPGDPTNFTNHSGNGILAGLCKNVLIEYCTATNNGWDMPRTGNGPVGIWCYEADSVVIQHCLSYRNKTSKGGADGGGFDLDGGVTNSIIQYCLSYENQGSGYGIFQYAGASRWNNNTIRYCISENDGSVSPAHASVFIWNSSADTSQFSNCYFYNNTIYNAKGAVISYEAQSKNAGFRFYNNIFVGKNALVLGKETNSTYLANNWYSLKDRFNSEENMIFVEWANAKKKEIWNGNLVGLNMDPSFRNAGSSNIFLPGELLNFSNYQLPTQSILRTKGLDLQKLFGIDNGGKSFNQNPATVNGIGACF